MGIVKLPQAAQQAAGGREARCRPPTGWAKYILSQKWEQK